MQDNDVVLKEDNSPLCDGYAPVNFSIVRTISMNLFRQNGFASITKGLRQLAHDVHRLFFFFKSISPAFLIALSGFILGGSELKVPQNWGI
jgi:hypothetical protein